VDGDDGVPSDEDPGPEKQDSTHASASEITLLRQTKSMTTAVLIAAKPDQDASDLPTSP